MPLPLIGGKDEKMQTSESKSTQKKPHVGFSFKQRLIPSVLVALAISLTLCVFGPFEIYGANAEQFGFSLTDFLGWSLLYTLGLAAVICAILLPLRGRAFDIVFAIFFWIGLMLMIQGNYLNTGISSLTGDGMGTDGFAKSKVILNTVIWAIVGVGCLVAILLTPSAHRDLIRTVSTIAMITVIGMQLITFGVTSMTSDVWTQKNHSISGDESEELPHLLTFENLDRVSTEKNVIWFVVDRFDVSYFEEAQEKCPEIFYNLDGFTYFDDMTAMYPRTYPSISYMLTGAEHDFRDKRDEYLKDAYVNSEFLKILKENNYRISIYTDQFYGYDDARHLEAYVSNASPIDHTEVVDKPILTWDMTRLSLFRFLPVAAKGVVGEISTPTFQKYVIYQTDHPRYESYDMKVVHDFLTENAIEAVGGENNFTFLHISGCHMPNQYDENFGSPSKGEKYDATVSLKQSFQIINRYLDQLKELGLYEDATIIITGDHGWHGGSDTTLPTESGYPLITTLLVKESGASEGALKTSSAPVMQGDIIPTILKSEGITTATDFGMSVFDVPEDQPRKRKYNFQSLQYTNGETDYEVIEYEIVGRARDLKSWTIVDRYRVGDIYY